MAPWYLDSILGELTSLLLLLLRLKTPLLLVIFFRYKRLVDLLDRHIRAQYATSSQQPQMV
jgi:hypothetical protein